MVDLTQGTPYFVKITNPEKFDLILKMFDNILVVSWHKL